MDPGKRVLHPAGVWTFYRLDFIANFIDRSGLIDRPSSLLEATMFSHQRLKVYDKALASVANLARCSALWDTRHSVVDHLLRASESIVLNLAEGARLWSDCHSIWKSAKVIPLPIRQSLR